MKDYGDLEHITRKFCERRGIDPDAQVMIACPDGRTGCMVAHYGPAWKNYERTVRDGIALIEVIGGAVNGDGNHG